MIKILSNLLKQDKEKFVVPDCIPIYAIYDDGVFRVGREIGDELMDNISLITRLVDGLYITA